MIGKTNCAHRNLNEKGRGTYFWPGGQVSGDWNCDRLKFYTHLYTFTFFFYYLYIYNEKKRSFFFFIVLCWVILSIPLHRGGSFSPPFQVGTFLTFRLPEAIGFDQLPMQWKEGKICCCNFGSIKYSDSAVERNGSRSMAVKQCNGEMVTRIVQVIHSGGFQKSSEMFHFFSNVLNWDLTFNWLLVQSKKKKIS